MWLSSVDTPNKTSVPASFCLFSCLWKLVAERSIKNSFSRLSQHESHLHSPSSARTKPCPWKNSNNHCYLLALADSESITWHDNQLSTEPALLLTVTMSTGVCSHYLHHKTWRHSGLVLFTMETCLHFSRNLCTCVDTTSPLTASRTRARSTLDSLHIWGWSPGPFQQSVIHSLILLQ